jgi:aminoglycoside phosphotransferase (APT) family kinase protein
MENMRGKLLGSGGTSNVYEWGKNEVIKIYKPHVSDGTIENEMYIGQLLNNFSLEIPRYIGSTNINGERALIYERINGTIMAEPLLGGGYNEELARIFAQMHFDIHKKSIDELPSQYDFLKNRIIELESILGDHTIALLSLLEDIPKDSRLCHGDYQPLNVIGEANQYIVIDWNGACSGNPVFDVAWTYMTLNSPVIKTLIGETSWDNFNRFKKDYISYYCEISGIKENDVLRCLPIVASRRLYDNSASENDISRQEKEWLINLIYNR